MKKTITLSLLFPLVVACGGGGSQEKISFEEAVDTTADTGPEIDPELVAAFIDQIPSPLEISVLIKESGSPYNRDVLNSDENMAKYNTQFKQALNLGVYGTDLGYCNLYEQNQDAQTYLIVIKDLADALAIGQFFNLEKIRELTTNSQNLNELLTLTTQNFNDINSYLQTQERSNLSLLLLAGGWIEAMHILCAVLEEAEGDTEELKSRIGEQKIILENIEQLVGFFVADPSFKSLHDDLLKLKAVYDQVEIITTYGETTYEIVNGVPQAVTNSTQEVKITDENVADIVRVTKEIRGKIIS